MGNSLRIRFGEAWKLYGFVLLLKLSMEYAYVKYLYEDGKTYWALQTNSVKYVYGLTWMTLLFFLIQHKKNNASSFLLQFFFVMQILPMTSIYALQDESTAFYTVICLSVAVCEVMVARLKVINLDFKISYISQEKILIGLFIMIAFGFLVWVYWVHEFPTTTALDLYKVYKMRREGIYQGGGYLATTLMNVMIPVLLSYFLIKGKYFLTLLIYGMEFIIYLYSAHKIQLFMGLFIIGVVVFIKRGGPQKIWYMFCAFWSCVCFFVQNDIGRRLFSLFIRRMFFLNSVIRYYYYDFFSSHTLIGFSGIFPRWLISFESPYGSYKEDYFNTVPHIIGAIYFHDPMGGANSGFLSEGYMRFGLIGILVALILFAFILKLVDGFQKKTSYVFAVGCSAGIVLQLADGHLIDATLCGYITVWLLFLLFYREEHRAVKQVPKMCMGKRGGIETGTES